MLACASAQAAAQKQQESDDKATPLSHRLAAAVAAKLEAQADAARTKMAAAETAARLSCQERKVAMVRRLAGC